MSSAHYVMLAIACILGGVVTHILAPQGPIALLLVTSGAGALGKAGWDKNREAQKERKRGDYWQEQTQTMQKK